MADTIRALRIHQPKGEDFSNLSFDDIPSPILENKLDEPALGIRMEAVALNRRDYWQTVGLYPGVQFPSVLGSCGAGQVMHATHSKDEHWLGKRVIINPNIDWGDDRRHQGKNYRILGGQVDGTFQQVLLVPTHRVHQAPSHLTAEEAAALPLAGLTAWRALIVHGKAIKGHRVLVTGVGSGVQQFVCAFAQALGAQVWVTSSKQDVLQAALDKGAAGAVNYKEDGWKQTLKAAGGFDLIVDSAGGEQLNDLIDLAAMAGSIVFYGATNGAPSTLSMPKIFWKQLRLQGSTMGSDHDFADMLAFVQQHVIHPQVGHVYAFEAALEAFRAMRQGTNRGKLVLRF